MNTINIDSRGTMVQGRNRWSIDNALVEEVFTDNGRTGYVVVSYAVRGNRGMIHIELLQLNVNRNTAVRNVLGLPMCLCDLRRGMWVDAEFSPAFTRSIPPQTNAFRIAVSRRIPLPIPTPQPQPQPQPQLPPSFTRTDRIAYVDTFNNFLIVGDPNNINEQMRFVITNETLIFDRGGNRIPLQMLRPGQLVEVTHATFQTASIPPQTTAFRVQVI